MTEEGPWSAAIAEDQGVAAAVWLLIEQESDKIPGIDGNVVRGWLDQVMFPVLFPGQESGWAAPEGDPGPEVSRSSTLGPWVGMVRDDGGITCVFSPYGPRLPDFTRVVVAVDEDQPWLGPRAQEILGRLRDDLARGAPRTGGESDAEN